MMHSLPFSPPFPRPCSKGNIRTSILSICVASLIHLLLVSSVVAADPQPEVTVGIPTVLSGDFAVLGQNIERTTKTYTKHYLRHRLRFVFEDARINSTDGLRAYQKLINVDRVDVVVSGCSTNCLVAGKGLINSSRTPTLSIVTGGKAADEAGPYVFRLGNDDTMNGTLEAERLLGEGLKRVALFTEDTEYTLDVRNGFVERFPRGGGQIVVEERFAPDTVDFRSLITVARRGKPDALLILTQTGRALGLFLKQWSSQNAPAIPISTTFVAAANPDARSVAGRLLDGVRYMNPAYDSSSPRWKEFLERFEQDHGSPPAIAFHAAGTVDSLNLLQDYLDKAKRYDRDEFQRFLLAVKQYQGLMGEFSFDAEGNSDLGFTPAVIEAVSD